MDEMIRKHIEPEIKRVSEGVFEFVGSTEDLDRDGEVIIAKGWDTANYKKNPVVLWGHDYRGLPIGRAKAVIENKQLKFKEVTFADAETYPFADTVRRLIEGGYINTVSVGFIPKEWKDGQTEGEPRRTYTKQELLEVSVVPVPSNPNALVDARAAGIITAKEFDNLKELEGAELKPEVTEEYIRIPVPGESGKHDGHKIRTIDIDKDKGIKALYCVECKKVITYLFDKSKWNMDRASQWVRDHTGKEHGPKAISQEIIKDELDYVISLISEGDLNDESIKMLEIIAREYMRLTGDDMPDDILIRCGEIAETRASQYNQVKASVNAMVNATQSEPEPEPEPEYLKVRNLGREELRAMLKSKRQERSDYELGIVR
ncbi:MAG: HK97 family phage prohead protease [Chloroflexota bacterium]|nr:HK97 family phage prohead protease [Chloroflexota bacterium]